MSTANITWSKNSIDDFAGWTAFTPATTRPYDASVKWGWRTDFVPSTQVPTLVCGFNPNIPPLGSQPPCNVHHTVAASGTNPYVFNVDFTGPLNLYGNWEAPTFELLWLKADVSTWIPLGASIDQIDLDLDLTIDQGGSYWAASEICHFTFAFSDDTKVDYVADTMVTEPVDTAGTTNIKYRLVPRPDIASNAWQLLKSINGAAYSYVVGTGSNPNNYFRTNNIIQSVLNGVGTKRWGLLFWLDARPYEDEIPPNPDHTYDVNTGVKINSLVVTYTAPVAPSSTGQFIRTM